MLATTHRIRDILERHAKAVALRPAIGQGTAKTRVRYTAGLACEVTEGDWTLTVDMSEKSGGTNTGPNPGVLGRGALGSCLVVGYAMWAARLNVPLTSLEVDIEADYDRRGELGVDDTVPAGYTQVRYVVAVESPAPEADVRKVIDTADRYSSYIDVYRRAHDVRRELRITTTG
jgi:uncharacterized OsmC-like protein